MAESLDQERVEEEVRKRLFWEESMHGPFEVRGQEHRRTVGAHATHQTHSFPGTGGLNYNNQSEATGRQLSGCAICARSMWLEEAWPEFIMNFIVIFNCACSLFVFIDARGPSFLLAA